MLKLVKKAVKPATVTATCMALAAHNVTAAFLLYQIARELFAKSAKGGPLKITRSKGDWRAITQMTTAQISRALSRLRDAGAIKSSYSGALTIVLTDEAQDALFSAFAAE